MVVSGRYGNLKSRLIYCLCLTIISLLLRDVHVYMRHNHSSADSQLVAEQSCIAIAVCDIDPSLPPCPCDIYPHLPFLLTPYRLTHEGGIAIRSISQDYLRKDGGVVTYT